jgi:diguanylate cyclase (GGDEF)-like protein
MIDMSMLSQFLSHRTVRLLGWLRTRLLPPSGLHARLRWLFVLAALGADAALAGSLLLNPNPSRPSWIAALAALGVLAALQLRTHRRGGPRFAYLEMALESALIGVAVLGSTEIRSQMWLYYLSMESRALYGTWRQIGASIVTQSLSFLMLAVVWPILHGEPTPLTAPELSGYPLGFALSAGLMHFISLTAIGHERGAARERSLAKAGVALVGVADRSELYAAAIEAVTDLLLGTPIGLVALGLRRPDGVSVIVAAEGRHADRVRGMHIKRSGLPRRAVEIRGATQSVLDRESTAAIQRTLGLPYTDGVVTLTQLHLKGENVGTLVLESPERLPSETAHGLTTLAAEIALALDSIRLTEHLHDLAYRDPLTGLANRAHFMARLHDAISSTSQRGTQVAVLFLDLDDFKLINDSLGHAAGDELLRTIADRLRTCVRDGDLVARLGGDEFTILLESVETSSEAQTLAEQIADELRRPLAVEERVLTLGASVGIAVLDDTHTDADAGELLRAADLALYAAKARGKSQTAMFDPSMAAAALERLELEAELRGALERGEFEVYYQPIVSFQTGAVEEVEALVRWNHPERGLVGPAAFISIAEKTGLIVPLGAWVLETACREVVGWQRNYPLTPPLTLSVNLSARQLHHPSLVDDVSDILRNTGLDPSALKLEITESVVVADTAHNRSVLTGLRALGIRLAIDDFGTGNSAMEYLLRFPVDTLKIDRSFIASLGQDERATSLVRGIIGLAKGLGLHVTGEGVETDAQSAQLRQMGCDVGQGFLFARPLPAAELEATLRPALPKAA